MVSTNIKKLVVFVSTNAETDIKPFSINVFNQKISKLYLVRYNFELRIRG